MLNRQCWHAIDPVAVGWSRGLNVIRDDLPVFPIRDSKGNQERFVPRPAATWQICRTTQSPVMLAQCAACESPIFVPHSWGHRNAPHCPHPESQQGLERQLKKQLPAEYFLLTFTVPEAFRALAWQPQRTLYSIMTRC
ncbi:MAG: transposase zinc-binding domain-containing protein, partial [Methylococcales bacterium]